MRWAAPPIRAPTKLRCDALDRLENRLADGRAFLRGDELLASDVLLFTPAVRFDLVYRPIFRACLKRFSDYPALSRWLERILALPNVAATVRSDEILAHYDDGWAPRCPSIVPLQPAARAARAWRRSRARQVAQEVPLAELNAVVAQDRVGGREVEVEVRQGEVQQVGPA